MVGVEQGLSQTVASNECVLNVFDGHSDLCYSHSVALNDGVLLSLFLSLHSINHGNSLVS